jgi:hypothetical protein
VQVADFYTAQDLGQESSPEDEVLQDCKRKEGFRCLQPRALEKPTCEPMSCNANGKVLINGAPCDASMPPPPVTCFPSCKQKSRWHRLFVLCMCSTSVAHSKCLQPAGSMKLGGGFANWKCVYSVVRRGGQSTNAGTSLPILSGNPVVHADVRDHNKALAFIHSYIFCCCIHVMPSWVQPARIVSPSSMLSSGQKGMIRSNACTP